MTSDPHHARHIHGLFALVADPNAPGGVRFATPGDRAETFISSPGELPDGETSVRILDNEAAASTYVAAVREIGGAEVFASTGAAFDILLSNSVIVVRRDREKPAADTLEQAVSVRIGLDTQPISPSQRLAERFADSRAAAAKRHSEELVAAAGRNEWSAEIGLVEDDPRLSIPTWFRPEPGAPLDVQTTGNPEGHRNAKVSIKRDGHSYLVRFADQERLFGFDDLEKEYLAMAAALGIVVADGMFATRSPTFGAEAIFEALDAANKLEEACQLLDRDEAARESGQDILNDAALTRVIERAAAGFLLYEMRGYYGQISPRSGTFQNVSEGGFDGHLNRWIEPAWKGRFRTERVRLYRLTDAGLLLAARDLNGAARAMATKGDDDRLVTDGMSAAALGALAADIGARLTEAQTARLRAAAEQTFAADAAVSFDGRPRYNGVKTEFGAVLASLVGGARTINEADEAVPTGGPSSPRP